MNILLITLLVIYLIVMPVLMYGVVNTMFNNAWRHLDNTTYIRTYAVVFTVFPFMLCMLWAINGWEYLKQYGLTYNPRGEKYIYRIVEKEVPKNTTGFYPQYKRFLFWRNVRRNDYYNLYSTTMSGATQNIEDFKLILETPHKPKKIIHPYYPFIKN